MILRVLIFLYFISSLIYSQSAPKDFFDALINNKENIKDFVDETELSRSERLGITYTGVKNKFILGNDIQENVNQEIRSGNFKYEIHETPLEESYSLAYFVIPQLKDSLKFYFNKGKYIDPSSYLTRNWQTKESKYFIFKISEPKYFNDYCIQKLDEFTDKLLDSMDFSRGERELLQQQKIFYIFCKDEKEVGLLTGIRSKGQAMLAFDEVITAYQTHFHEVSHLLINYKLKNLGLFTLPFLMEGFAVAMGGRGGMAPRVVTDIGYFLQKSGEASYDSILTYESFNSNDAGITYSVAGLYNSFLFEELGMKQYLELYKKVNGDLDFVQNIKASKLTLPEKEKFENYLKVYNDNKNMYVDEKDTLKPTLNIRGLNGNFIQSGKYIKFFLFDKFQIGFEEIRTDKNYISRKYIEIYKDQNYDNDFKYCISASNETIDVYNLFNDELIYSYNKGLSADNILIPKINGLYTFFINSELFGNDFNSNIFIIEGIGR